MPSAPRSCSLAMVGATLLCIMLVASASAADLHIKLPKRSKETPVQAFNRQGVKAIEKHDYTKAKRLFYRAYLLDPDNPFTLNNLGYVAELEGNVDRAQRFYELASEQPSDAVIDKSNSRELIGKTVSQVAGHAQDRAMDVNQLNVTAIGLLMKGRAPEADLVLHRALKLDAKNAYTLNNLGYASEQEGELEAALNYYRAAADLHSKDAIVVTPHADWRGKPISKIAAENAKKVADLMKRTETPEAKVARLNLQGVSALNRNDRGTARKDFEAAYKIDPHDAFTLNNMGYLAEMDGDKETAEFYYEKAQEAQRADVPVGVATRRDAEGLKLAAVADSSDQSVDTEMQKIIEQKRREGGPVLLRHRDNTPVIEPAKPPAPLPEAESAPAENPPAASPAAPSQPAGGLMQPLPDNAQPPNANTGATPPSANPQPSPNNQPQGGVMEPLPDNQQPPNANKGAVPPPANTTPPANPPQNQPQGGVMEPLPDSQQPPNANKGAVPPPANPSSPPPANQPQQGSPPQR